MLAVVMLFGLQVLLELRFWGHFGETVMGK